MISTLRSIWREIVTPSLADEPPYTILLIAIAHAVLGASLAMIDAGLPVAVARAAIPLAYWLLKERGDLKRGGNVVDGLVDTAFVAFGAIYAGQPWWPASVLALAALAALILPSRRTPSDDPS